MRLQGLEGRVRKVERRSRERIDAKWVELGWTDDTTHCDHGAEVCADCALDLADAYQLRFELT